MIPKAGNWSEMEKWAAAHPRHAFGSLIASSGVILAGSHLISHLASGSSSPLTTLALGGATAGSAYAAVAVTNRLKTLVADNPAGIEAEMRSLKEIPSESVLGEAKSIVASEKEAALDEASDLAKAVQASQPKAGGFSFFTRDWDFP